MQKERWALISVTFKDGIVEFAATLTKLGFKIMASGGTASLLSSKGIDVTGVDKFVGGGAILGDRVKTLSRQLHAGLLAQYIEKDLAEMENLGLPYIDLACVDFYQLQKEVDREGSTPESVLEKTDIGGPAMVRSGSKGRRIVICDPSQRQEVLEWLQNGEPDREKFVTALAAKGEFTVAQYCLTSATYWGEGEYAGILGRKVFSCKYGENAYQTPAALYRSSTADDDSLSLDKFELIDGAPPSYNNFCDIGRLVQTVTHIAATMDVNLHHVPAIAVAVKHGNACGAAVNYGKAEAVEAMLGGDPLAIFGGLVMVNFTVDEEVANLLLYHGSKTKRILDGIIAPCFDEAAVKMLGRKGGKCRLLANPALAELNRASLDDKPIIRPVRGGFLRQPNYTFILDLADQSLEKHGRVNEMQEVDMLLAKAICDTSNSNTITLVKNGMLIGNGTGQQSRVSGALLAISLAERSGHDVAGAVAASDSFFPFIDGPEVLTLAGVRAIISTSGSVKDSDVIEHCRKMGVILYMIPDSKGRGFYKH